ncbi:MAG: Lpg1974 family pore-forming outer membrane protein [bacterium]|nr:Lpg1974 family pore-forming outer membrane protein [bacterium]
MFKKKFSGVLFFCFIGTYAHSAEPAKHVLETKNDTNPCKTNGWDIAISTLYLQPSSVLHTPLVSETNNTISQRRFIKTLYDWGFGLEGSYYFDKAHQVTVDWLNFSDKNSGIYSLSELNDASFSASTKINVVNVVYVQGTKLGANSAMKLFLGGQFASFRNQNNTILTTPQGTFQTTNISHYNGVGPRLGANLSQELPHGFNAFAQGAMSLLIGNEKGKQFGLTNLSVYNHSMQMVPNLDFKLGLGYDINMNKAAISVTGGWMFQHYFDVILMNDEKSTYGYSLNGPYIKAKWTSMV